MNKLIKISLVGLLAISCSSQPKKEATVAGDLPRIKNYNYKKLQVRDYEQMLTLVRNRIERAEEISIKAQDHGNEAEEELKALVLLKNAMTLILTRPNASNDNMATKLAPFVRRELNNYDAYYKTMDIIVSAALNNLMSDSVSNNHKVGSTFILENAMSELKPELKNEAYVKKIFEKIKNTELTLDQKIISERLLQAMYSSSSPSETAERILKETFPEEKEKGFFSNLFGG